MADAIEIEEMMLEDRDIAVVLEVPTVANVIVIYLAEEIVQ